MTSLLSAALLHFIWQGTLIALLLWVVLAFTRKQAASARYLICCTAMTLMAALPAATAWVLYEPAPALRQIFFLHGAPFPAAIAGVQPERWLGIALRWALPVWAFGVVAFSFRMMWFYGQVAWMRRRGEQANEWLITIARDLARRMGVFGEFTVLISAEGRGPSVIGWLRPVILVPAAAMIGLTPQQLEAVLAHELAHIRRADYLVNLLQSVVETLLFYHPAVWWVSGRIRAERELCCDDLAVRFCGDALAYARALTILERFRMSVPRMAMASVGGSLIYRIHRIVGTEVSATSKAPGLVALAVVLVLGVLSLNRAKAQAPPLSAAPPVAAQAPQPTVAPKQVVAHPPEVDDRKTMGADDRAVLDDLRKQLAELSLQYNSDHPRVRQLQQMLQEAELNVQNNEPIDDLRLKLDELRRTFKPEYPEIARLQEKIANAEGQTEAMNRIRSAIARSESLIQVAEAGLTKSDDVYERNRLSNLLLTLRTQLNFFENELMLSETQAAEDPSPAVEKITVSGLSNEAQQQLLSRLPVHVGSRLSSMKFRDYFAAIDGFDKDLEFAIVMLPDGKAEVRITAPKK